MSSWVVFMQKLSTHLSVRSVCVWLLLCDSFSVQQFETDNVCSAPTETWKTSHNLNLLKDFHFKHQLHKMYFSA